MFSNTRQINFFLSVAIINIDWPPYYSLTPHVIDQWQSRVESGSTRTRRQTDIARLPPWRTSAILRTMEDNLDVNNPSNVASGWWCRMVCFHGNGVCESTLFSSGWEMERVFIVGKCWNEVCECIGCAWIERAGRSMTQ